MCAEFPTHLETALSKMPWIWRSNSHPSHTGITSPSAFGREERVSTRATWRQEISCSVSRVACAVAPRPVWKSERLINFPVGRIQRDVIWWSRGLESKGCRVARKVMNQFRCGHLGSQRHRGKKSPSLAPQFTSMNARSKLQLRVIRKGTNQAEKPRRDWRCNGIRLLQGSIQFRCLKWISEDGIQSLFEVSNSLIQKGIILTSWFLGKMG